MRLVVRILSELCLTVGAGIVLFVVYVVFWTGVTAQSAAGDQITALQERWTRSQAPAPAPASSSAPDPTPAPTPTPAPGNGAPEPYRDGRPFAVMYVPRFGADWDWPVLEGTAAATLRKGLGHYARTAPLGATGNFAVAGHRRTYGDPFKDFPRLRSGDAVILNDGTTWFTYRVTAEPYRTVPTDTGVVDPVPEKSGFGRPGRYLTLTTCDPEWGSSHRLVAWARLESTRAVTQGKPPAFHR
ncbi:class E sortase [Streptomyces sp. NPDC047928]|uniref:class E sortase n=1 Tax=Streptomyces sp. NPDC047928 TaxID=3365492 RepID=UPI0037203D9E